MAAPRRPILYGRYLHHDDIPNPRYALPPRALSDNLSSQALQGYISERQVRDNQIYTSETERMAEVSHRALVTIDTKHKLLESILRSINRHLSGPSEITSRQLLRNLHARLNEHLYEPANAPPAGHDTRASLEPQDPNTDFHNGNPFFEPGNQCLSPVGDDADAVHALVEAARNHGGVRKAFEALPRGELAPEAREPKLKRADKRWNQAVHGRFDWATGRSDMTMVPGATQANPLWVDSPERPPYSPITPPRPPYSPITPPPPPYSPITPPQPPTDPVGHSVNSPIDLISPSPPRVAGGSQPGPAVQRDDGAGAAAANIPDQTNPQVVNPSTNPAASAPAPAATNAAPAPAPAPAPAAPRRAKRKAAEDLPKREKRPRDVKKEVKYF